jgi:hypothetical protein
VIPDQVQDREIGDSATVCQALPFRIADTLAAEALVKLLEQPGFPHTRLPDQSHDLAPACLDLFENTV